MAYTQNHCDLNKMEDKIVSGFTLRQILSFVAIVLIGIPTYVVMYRNGIDSSLSCIVIAIIAVPLFLLGNYKDSLGRNAEKIIIAKIKLVFFSETIRPYATNNTYSAAIRQSNIETQMKIISNQNKN